MDATPPVSVIVRTRDSERTLAEVLDGLAGQSVAPEIVVVDSGSADGTLEIAGAFGCRVVALEPSAFSYGRALNAGAAAASAPIHFAVSSHSRIPRPDWIALALARYEEHPDIAAVSGQPAMPGGRPLTRVYIQRAGDEPDPRWGFSNHASSWRADVWRAFPFDEDLPACEDLEWSRRVRAAGFAVALDPELVIPPSHRRTQGVRALYRRERLETVAIGSFADAPQTTFGDAVREWWSRSSHPPGTVALRQRLSPYRAARIAGRWSASRELRSRPPRDRPGPAREPRRPAVDQELARRIAAFPRWHYEFDFGGVRTPIFDASVRNRHAQRRRYLFEPLLALCGGDLRGRRVLDLGCNAGYWSLQCAQAGAEQVVGIDGRQMHVDQADLVFEASGIDPARYDFRVGNVFALDEALGDFDVVLNLGLMYHVAKPMELVELIAACRPELVVTDTEIAPGAGSFLAVRTGEPLDEPRNAIDYETVMIPSREAVIDLYATFGLRTVTLRPRFSSWESAADYRAGSRRAFISSRTLPLDGLDVEEPGALRDATAAARASRLGRRLESGVRRHV